MEKELGKEKVDEELVRLGWRPEKHNGVIVYTRDDVPLGSKGSPKRIQKRKVAKTKQERQ